MTMHRQEETNDDSDDDDVILEFSLSEVHSSLPAECPFTFLYLSSEDSTKDEQSMRMSKTALCPMLLQQSRALHMCPLLLTKYLGATARREKVGLMPVELNSIT